MTRAFFITGTDTGVGKTRVACALLRAFAAQGKRVVGMKPIAAGSDENGRFDDLEMLRSVSNVQAAMQHISPFRFAPAIAPHIAAQLAGIQISFEPIIKAFRELQRQADVVVVEGAGGIAVPLNEHQDMADLVVALDIPVILVVGMRLGCLNHALLSVQAIRHKGLRLSGWIANYVTSDMPAAKQNENALFERLEAPLLSSMPYATTFSLATCSGLLAKIT